MRGLFSKSASELRGIFLVTIAICTLLLYFSWWWLYGFVSSPLHLLTFVAALLYCTVQLLGSWLLYLATHRPTKQINHSDINNLSIDVFVTSNGEPLDLIANTLTAAKQMSGCKQVWLLDDSGDPTLCKLAKRLSVGYLSRDGSENAKAGNLNAALARTVGDIVVVFDIDHVPQRNFLEQAMPLFSTPSVGFVQTMLTFSNDYDGWIATAAAESSLDFYNPTSIGANGVGGATLIGSNALIRRKALDQIGGYQPGLAEDLATSIALHSAGWQSQYVPEVLAPGYAPPDASAWFTQQLKWARGVFELLFTRAPRDFRALNWGQRLSYLVRMTYYWIGIAAATHLVTTIGVLFASAENQALFQNYLLFATPLVTMTLLIRQLALRRWGHQSLSRSPQWRATVLVYATWPVYCIAWLMAMLRLPLRFRPTPKESAETIRPLWLIPQLLTTLLLIIGFIYHLLTTSSYFPLLYLATLIQAGLQLCFLLIVLLPKRNHALKSA